MLRGEEISLHVNIFFIKLTLFYDNKRKIADSQIEPTSQIVEAVKMALECTPPEI
jgi:hypothetical protein